MTPRFLVLILLSACLLLPLCVMAADAPQTAGGAPAAALHLSLLQLLLPVGTPIVIALIKALAPRIPSWCIPILAPSLGAIADLVANQTVGASMIASALLGLSGVGVREIQHQVKTRVQDGPQTN